MSGYYGFGNAGDEALLAGLTAGLNAAGHECEVLSADPGATRALHGLAAAHRVKGLLPALLRSDALVSGGGGLLQDATSGRSLAYYLTVVRLARLLGKPAVVYAQSVGPLSAAGRARVAAALRGIPVAVRDAPSERLLAGLGVRAQRVADPALLLPPPGKVDERGDTLLIPRGGHPALSDALAAAGRALQAEGRPVSLMAMQASEDEPEVERLERQLPGACVLPAGDYLAAYRHVAGAGFVLSVRLHGLIMAAAAGVGYAGLVYDPKVAGFLELASAPAFGPNVDHSALVEVALAQPDPPEAARARLLSAAGAGLGWLDRALRAGPRPALPVTMEP